MPKIELSEYELNLILNTLGEQPYVKVAATIQSIMEQVEAPKNCRECPHSCLCRSWYGGTGCKYREDVKPHDD